MVRPKEAYTASYNAVETFIIEIDGKDGLMPWLDWWHSRRQNMFRAFTGQDKPRSNLAEVVHAR